ncbi:Uncharacterized conserved protein, contains LRR repeats [Plasmopara halstedii]|uniref:Uncharacterized conserved protein, contains LRR repeats n=1 Tax=Plasmopara halstedii TaxID=4781 RepID=A0A0P1A931_PLAHL|nr:Uncharacterized conserved protein, contains LRR repeats [Plasmopara halstedii]CEG36874.1 Uncharacterized conserved protein, contains LRR repeats [Plasmopara halstedii]|eukprot:XP_024573243.1 Uncharacterized conserved protein, contains LRR repeats [Plasmopara halstedii]
MDSLKALDMEHRSGISHEEVEEFANRMDMISKAMDEIKNGTFDPLQCKIPGYKTPEQEEVERKAQLKREDERCKREAERKRKEKQEEHENWWRRAKLRFSIEDTEVIDETNDKMSKSKRWANRILAAYKTRDANDYSLWNRWEPEDPVTLQEKAERENELEKLRNREFETQNPDFCDQFKKDMDERQKSQNEKTRLAEQLKQRGNGFYKKKEYMNAIKNYKDALLASPFNVAILANIAQCYLRLEEYDECIEFCTRTLFLDPKYIKALSRRATAWHHQKKFQKAADDMKKALELDKENVDIIEQHSIIVGDYEDLMTKQELEMTLQRVEMTKDGAHALASEPSSLDELRFYLNMIQKMNEHTVSDKSSYDRVHDAWVAYDLVLPIIKANDHVRTIFRTSGEMDKLCARISTALQFPNEVNDGTRQHTETTILSAMINCATAAVANTPRNQVILFRNEDFRQHLLTYFKVLSATSFDRIIQSSILCFLEQVVELKSWKNEILASNNIISSLLAALCLPVTVNASSDENTAGMTITLAGASICFTLSSEIAGIQTFTRCGCNCLTAIATALEIHCNDDVKCNVLGFLSNLSTNNEFRRTIEQYKDNYQKLVLRLLEISQDNAIKSTISSTHVTLSERALGVLLNFSITKNSLLRTQYLFEFHAVDRIENILSHVTSSNFSALLLVLSRTVSLLCRLQPASKSSEQEFKHVIRRELLLKLYTVFEIAILNVKDETNVLSFELWQLFAQIWCHFGSCIHITNVRALLSEKDAVSRLLQVLALVHTQHVQKRFASEFNACERLIGNLVKVLIAMHSDNVSADLRHKKKLSILVKTLQNLPDGVARKNVAILLAKLCQIDPEVKDIVRDLRGIEMMMSISCSSAVSSR